MKTYKIQREVLKENRNAVSAADIYLLSEKSVLTTFTNLDEAKSYLKSLRLRAFRSTKFESVTNCGCRQFRAHTANSIFVFTIK